MFKRKSECQKVKGLLSPYIDQQLSSSERVLVEKHLAKCAVCSVELESLRATVNLLHRVPIVSPTRSFAIVEVEPRRRLAPFALVSTATAMSVSALVFFFAGDAFNLFEPRVTEDAVKLAAPPPAPGAEVDQARDMAEFGAEVAEKWPLLQIEIALIGVSVVLLAVTFILWRRRRRAVGARVGRA